MRDDERTAPISRVTALTADAPIAALIRVTDADATPPTFVLRTGSCVLGSSRTCDLVVADTTVSRRHVSLELVPEGVAVQDLGSRNGTFYLGQRIERAVLDLGARIKLGGVSVTLEADRGTLDALLPKEEPDYARLVGASVVMRRLFAMLVRLEGSLATVLIQGESGTGKELVAEALHEQSRVSDGPFVALNCGAIPRDMLASELFGHKRGAFTGAHESRKGAFESADGGTLFLDEIGELPLEVQPTLLRALENGEIRPVGEDRSRRVKVRLLAATNRDLEGEVARGTFRRDLFFRLAVVRLLVPPLRERREDIEPLARSFASRLGLTELPRDFVESLKAQTFSGNVRELRNAVESFAALGFVQRSPSASGGPAEADSLEALVDLTRPYGELKEAVVERFTVAYLRALLLSTHGNQSEAARISGLNRGYIGRLIGKYGLTPRGRSNS
jgi:DNA-binding NtrC family response regulator